MFFPDITLIQPLNCRNTIHILTLGFFVLFLTGCFEPAGQVNVPSPKIPFETRTNMKLKQRIFEHSIFSSDQIQDACFSLFDSSLVIVCEAALYKLRKKEIERIVTSSGKVISGDVIMIEPTLVYQGEVQNFHMPYFSNRAVWLDGDDIVIFDISEGKVEKRLPRLSGEEDVVDAYLSPTGQWLLFVVESDKEEDDFLFYNWYLSNIATGDTKAVFSEPMARPPDFLFWLINETKMLFRDAVDGIPFSVDIRDFSRQKFKLPVFEAEVESLLPSLEYDYIAITTTDRLGRGRVSITTRELDVLKESDTDEPDSDFHAVEWSPGTPQLLVFNRMTRENRYYLLQTNREGMDRLMTLDSRSLDFKHPTWLYDDLHMVWPAPKELHFFVLPMRR